MKIKIGDKAWKVGCPRIFKKGVCDVIGVDSQGIKLKHKDGICECTESNLDIVKKALTETEMIEMGLKV